MHTKRRAACKQLKCDVIDDGGGRGVNGSNILCPICWDPLRLFFDPSSHFNEHVGGYLEVVVDDHPVKVVAVLGLNFLTFVVQLHKLRFLKWEKCANDNIASVKQKDQ